MVRYSTGQQTPSKSITSKLACARLPKQVYFPWPCTMPVSTKDRDPPQRSSRPITDREHVYGHAPPPNRVAQIPAEHKPAEETRTKPVAVHDDVVVPESEKNETMIGSVHDLDCILAHGETVARPQITEIFILSSCIFPRRRPPHAVLR